MPIRRRPLALLTTLLATLAAAPAAHASVTITGGPGHSVDTSAASVTYTFTTPDAAATLHCKGWRQGTSEPAPVPCGTGGAGSFALQLPEEGEWRFAVAESADAPENHWQHAYARVDRTAPVAEINRVRTSGWRAGVAENVLWESAATFRLQPWLSSDPSLTFVCRRDGGAWAPCADNPAWQHAWGGLPDGEHVLEARATDAAGNVQQTPTAYRFVVDTTPPDTTFVSTPPATGATTPMHTFVAAGSEGGTRFRCFHGASSYGCTGTTHSVALLSGTSTFRIAAEDGAGNVDPTPAEFTWTVGKMAWDTGAQPTGAPLTVRSLTFPKTIRAPAAMHRAYRRAAAKCAKAKSAKRRTACLADARDDRTPDIAWKLSRPAAINLAIIRHSGGRDTVLHEWRLSTPRPAGTLAFDGIVKAKMLPKGSYVLSAQAVDNRGGVVSAGTRVRFRVA